MDKNFVKNWKEIAQSSVPKQYKEFMKGDGRRPDSVIFSDIETDVKRRDLTMNALFYDIGTMEIVDLVGGIDDIRNKVVRTVGSPDERFNEDRLRILRAIRFSARTGSPLSPEIDKALKTNNSLSGISGERIRDEFLKGIKSAKSVKYFLILIAKYGLFDWVFRGITPINNDFVESRDYVVVLAILLIDADVNKVKGQLNKLNYTTDEITQIVFLIKLYNDLNVDGFYDLKLIHKDINSSRSPISDDTVKDFSEFTDMNFEIVNAFLSFKLSISGDEVMSKFGISQGKGVYDKKRELETKLFIKTI